MVSECMHEKLAGSSEKMRTGATDPAPARILMLDDAAARTWLARVIAQRAIVLCREHRKRSTIQASIRGGSHGHGIWRRKRQDSCL